MQKEIVFDAARPLSIIEIAMTLHQGADRSSEVAINQYARVP